MDIADSADFTLIDDLPALIWVSGPDHAGTYFNRTWLEFTGRTLDQEQGDGWMDGVHPDDHPVLKECYGAFERHQQFKIEFRLRKHDGEYRWMLDHGVPRFSSCGEFQGFVGSCLDITDRKLAEERQHLFVAEWDHRVRNTLAAIRAILQLSVGGAQSKEEFAASLAGRIDAYAKVHRLLSTQQWEGASIRYLCAAILEPYGGEADRRIQLSGPDLILEPHAAMSFSLLVHELATNAAKYGALSAESGVLLVEWALRGEQVDICWQEGEGPPVSPPARQGFGSRLIEMLPRDIGGSGMLEFRPAGLIWRGELPATRALKSPPSVPAPGARPSITPDTGGGGHLSGARIFIAEDDPLIGMELEDLLCSAGARVIGPIATLSQALAAATDQQLDGAILDVNLRGELVTPLADLLTKRGVPFLFLTGYARRNLPSHFNNFPMLQKPAAPVTVLRRLSDLLTAPVR